MSAAGVFLLGRQKSQGRIEFFRMRLEPMLDGSANHFQIAQLVRADLIQLVFGDLMIEMNQAAISLYSLMPRPNPLARIWRPKSKTASRLRRRQDSAAQMFRRSAKKALRSASGRLRISPRRNLTVSRRSATTLLETGFGVTALHLK